MLAAIADGNASSGGMQLVARGCGLVGIIRLLKSSYLVLITERRLLGRVCSHAVYGIGATKLICVATSSAVDDAKDDGGGEDDGDEGWGGDGGKGGEGSGGDSIRMRGSFGGAETGSGGSGGGGGGGGGGFSVRFASLGGAGTVLTPTAVEADERRYKRLLSWVDLSKDFFFSYTYRLTATVQENMCGGGGGSKSGSGGGGGGGESGDGGGDGGGGKGGGGRASAAAGEAGPSAPSFPSSFGCASGSGPGTGSGSRSGSIASSSSSSGTGRLDDFDSMFSWNAHLSRPLRAALGDAAAARWLVPLVHGFFEQRRLSLLGRHMRVTLIARRSRHFAGTRYRRRGVNERGHVAGSSNVHVHVSLHVHFHVSLTRVIRST